MDWTHNIKDQVVAHHATGYRAPRDAAGGSSVLARMSDTMVYGVENYETHIRTFHVEHRQHGHEEFKMSFQDERLMLYDRITVETDKSDPGDDPLDALVAHFSWEQLKDKGLMSEVTYYRSSGARG